MPISQRQAQWRKAKGVLRSVVPPHVNDHGNAGRVAVHRRVVAGRAPQCVHDRQVAPAIVHDTQRVGVSVLGLPTSLASNESIGANERACSAGLGACAVSGATHRVVRRRFALVVLGIEERRGAAPGPRRHRMIDTYNTMDGEGR